MSIFSAVVLSWGYTTRSLAQKSSRSCEWSLFLLEESFSSSKNSFLHALRDIIYLTYKWVPCQPHWNVFSVDTREIFYELVSKGSRWVMISFFNGSSMPFSSSMSLRLWNYAVFSFLICCLVIWSFVMKALMASKCTIMLLLCSRNFLFSLCRLSKI